MLFPQLKKLLSTVVYELDEDECVTLKQGSTLATEAREHISLLFIENETTSHYCLITDLRKLLHHCSPVKSTSAGGDARKARVCKRKVY